MCGKVVLGRLGRVIFGVPLISLFLVVVMQNPAFAVTSVKLGWNPGTDPCIAGYNIYYGVASGIYTNKVPLGVTTNATISGLLEGTTYYFAATALNAAGVESRFSNETSWAVPLPVVNHPPTLNPISNMALGVNAKLQTVNLSGITSGATNEIQKLAVTAVSSKPTLIPNPTVTYTSPNTTGKLSFMPAHNATGTATLSVTVNDGQTQSNTVTRVFTVTVTAKRGYTITALTEDATAAVALQPATHADGQFALNIAGVTGYQYVVEASLDLANWIPVQTNTAPFVFVETNASRFSQRFYRLVSVP